MKIQNQAVRLILAKYDTGAGKKGAKMGPDALVKELEKLGVSFDDSHSVDGLFVEEDPSVQWCKYIETVANNSVILNNKVIDSIAEGKKTIIFSGDHSNAIGGLSGFVNANAEKRIGVIWIDAHADLHSPFTTPSGNMHGMPLAAMLGADNISQTKNTLNEKEIAAWENLKNIGECKQPKILPENIVFISLRDAEAEEWHLINEKNIKCFEPDYIKEHGIYNVINNCLKHLEKCDTLYVSFDVDSMDPSMANGTGTPVEDGLSKSEAEALLKTFIHHPKTGLLEITEINPGLDTLPLKMAELTAEILASALKA
jgi:arginase